MATEPITDEAAAVAEIARRRSAVATGCRILAANGHDDLVWGHASARDPQDRGVWLKANALGLDEIQAENVMLVDRDGQVLDGDGGRHAEYPIHTEIMAARPDVGGVVHTHPDHCVALAAAGGTLLPLSHAATMFVPPEVPRFTKTGDLITTPELGRDVAEALGDQCALLLVNHGIVTVGPDVETAVVRAVILERACKTQLLVRAHGGYPTWSSREEALAKRRNIYPDEHLRQVWRYLERQLPPSTDAGAL
jgi:L-fuculose-phosphate aldolase